MPLNDEQRIDVWKAYLAAFNAHSLEGIRDALSPECQVEYKGKISANNREEMLPNYSRHWERYPTPIELLSIRPFENGLWVRLRSWDEGKDIKVEYFYDDSGKQIKHIIQVPREIPMGELERRGKEEDTPQNLGDWRRIYTLNINDQ